jgi:hypothetical protein
MLNIGIEKTFKFIIYDKWGGWIHVFPAPPPPFLNENHANYKNWHANAC